MGAAGGGQAAPWPRSRAHTHLSGPGRTFLQAAMHPFQSWTLLVAGLAVEAAGMGERVNQMAPHGSFLLRCFWSLCSSLHTLRWEEIQGTILRAPEEREEETQGGGPGPPAPIPRSPEKRTHSKKLLPIFRQIPLERSPVCWGRASMRWTLHSLFSVERTQLYY